jgi:fatty-acyl-CoA synthase
MSQSYLLAGHVFRQAAAAVPDRLAICVGDRSLTYRALNAAGNRYAHVLRSAGIRKGDRVCWWCHTVLEAAPLFVALAKLGAIAVPVNAKLEPAEVAELVGRMAPRLIMTTGDRAERLAAYVPPDMIVRLDEGPSATWSLPLRAALARDGEIDEPALCEHDPHIIFFTSGTTGAGPKAAVISHRATWMRSFNGCNPPQPPSHGRMLTLFPQSSMGGWHLPMINWQDRGTVVWAEDADPEAALEAMQRHRITRLQTLPALWQRIMDAQPGRFDLSALRHIETGTSPTGPEFVDRLRDTFPNTVMRIFYGSTEAGTLLTLYDEDIARKPNSVGLPVPGVDLRISDGGELQSRSPFAFSGYYDDPNQSAAAFDGDWYRSGDLAAIDDDGYFSITGRVQEVIRTGGQWVSPWEVDEIVRTHPDIEDAACFGLPDAIWGELVCIAVQPKADRSVQLDDIRAFCRGRLASFKHPRRLEIVKAIPKTDATGKVMRAALRSRYTEQKADQMSKAD